MLGDLRILDAGDELLLDTERVALQELFNMIRRFSIGYDVELHKRTLERGLLSLIGPDAEAVAGAREPPGRRARARALSSLRHGRCRARAIRTDVGIDLLCDAARHRTRCGPRSSRRARPRSRRRPPSACGSSAAARATASISTTP